MSWYPHVTVATIVEKNGRYLVVEEIKNGKTVFNQPAGHLEEGETLIEAAIRETLEETQWQVEITGLLGCSLYKSSANGITYFRTSLIAKPLQKDENSPLDKDVERALWLSTADIEKNSDRLRSEMVLNDIRRYERGELYPLKMIHHLLPG